MGRTARRYFSPFLNCRQSQTDSPTFCNRTHPVFIHELHLLSSFFFFLYFPSPSPHSPLSSFFFIRFNDRRISNERWGVRWETKGEKLPFECWMRAKSLANSFPLIYRLVHYPSTYPQFHAKFENRALPRPDEISSRWISIICFVVVSSVVTNGVASATRIRYQSRNDGSSKTGENGESRILRVTKLF